MMVEVGSEAGRVVEPGKNHPRFTKRRLKVLQRIVDGFTSAEIASESVHSERTIERHRALMGNISRAIFVAVMEDKINVNHLPKVTLKSSTSREIDVLALMTIGCTNQAIADNLGLSRRTVETHVSHILGKMCVTRYQAIALGAYALKWALEAEAAGQALGV